MQKEFLFFTTGQFAKLHHLNKRTLHYYDDIGLFSPLHKDTNGYRYYTYRQSAELENILSLRELGMSIDEIKDYLKCPNTEAFLKIAAEKVYEIDKQIKHLKRLKKILQAKQKVLSFCTGIYDGKIEVIRLPKRFLLQTSIPFRETILTEKTKKSATSKQSVGSGGMSLDIDMEQVMTHLQIAWECSAYKTGCGSYIALDKIRYGQFEIYDGLFTFIDSPRKGIDLQVRPEGEYLYGYCIGNWDKIPALYQKMLTFAAENKLELTGNCYEIGLNEFAISCKEEYITQIEIPCS